MESPLQLELAINLALRQNSVLTVLGRTAQGWADPQNRPQSQNGVIAESEISPGIFVESFHCRLSVPGTVSRQLQC